MNARIEASHEERRAHALQAKAICSQLKEAEKEANIRRRHDLAAILRGERRAFDEQPETLPEIEVEEIPTDQVEEILIQAQDHNTIL